MDVPSWNWLHGNDGLVPSRPVANDCCLSVKDDLGRPGSSGLCALAVVRIDQLPDGNNHGELWERQASEVPFAQVLGKCLLKNLRVHRLCIAMICLRSVQSIYADADADSRTEAGALR